MVIYVLDLSILSDVLNSFSLEILSGREILNVSGVLRDLILVLSGHESIR